MIQAQLYAAVLKKNIEKDEYFKDFKIHNYRFIVVNRKTLTPLVWEFPYTFEYKPLIDVNGNIYRDPFTIGKELYYYLKTNAKVPNNINLNDLNIIKTLRPID